MSLCVTVFLAFVLSLSIVLTELPHASLQLSGYITYLALLAGCSALSVLLSTLVLSLHHRHGNTPVDVSWARFARCVRRYRRKKILDTLKNPFGSSNGKGQTDSQRRRDQEGDTKAADALWLTASEEGSERERSGLPTDPGRTTVALVGEFNRPPSDAFDLGLSATRAVRGEREGSHRMEKDRVTWEDVAHSLDFVLFRCFLAVVLVGTALCMALALRQYADRNQ